LKHCHKCNNKSFINGKCMLCELESMYTCDICASDVKIGKIKYGKLMCLKCITSEEKRQDEYKKACFKKNTCYKSKKSSGEGSNYEKEVLLCPNCGEL
jgi:hypothetical protein